MKNLIFKVIITNQNFKTFMASVDLISLWLVANIQHFFALLFIEHNLLINCNNPVRKLFSQSQEFSSTS